MLYRQYVILCAMCVQIKNVKLICITLSAVQVTILFSSYANFGLLAAVSCTKVHNVTGNKYKFARTVQGTATNHHRFGHLLSMLLTCYNRWCCM